ncbi:MgtC/SapB family protein [Desulfurobacterium sp.]
MIGFMKELVNSAVWNQYEPYFLSMIFGALVGIEREYKKQLEGTPAFGGIRTFILVSLLGTLSAHVASGSYPLVLPAVFIAVSAFILIAQKNEKEVGLTSEFAALATFFTGVLCFFREYQIAAVISIAVFSVLAFKKQMHEFVRHVTLDDLFAFLKFAVVTVIVYPLLPDRTFYGVNPRDVWAMVVVISTIDFIGYVLTKFVGSKKGTVITGLIGGLVSSTAVTVTLSSFAKRNPVIVGEYAAGIVGASAIMFFRILTLVFIVNPNLVRFFLFPCVVAALFGLIFSYVRAKLRKGNEKIEVENPYELSTAIKFGLFFGFILFITRFAATYAGALGIFVIAAVSGLSDVDAITLSMAKLYSSGEITAVVAVTAIFIAATVNTLFKWVLTYFVGGREIFMESTKGFLLLLAGEFLGLAGAFAVLFR